MNPTTPKQRPSKPQIDSLYRLLREMRSEERAAHTRDGTARPGTPRHQKIQDADALESLLRWVS